MNRALDVAIAGTALNALRVTRGRWESMESCVLICRPKKRMSSSARLIGRI